MDRFDNVMFIAPIMFILPIVIFELCRECQINWRKDKWEFEKENSGIRVNLGSIGTQTLEIAREYKGIKIEAMSAHSNIDFD